MRLRVKDVDFDRHVIIVREAKCNNDRVVMLTRSLAQVQQLLGYSDVSKTIIYTHVLKAAAGGTASPLYVLVV